MIPREVLKKVKRIEIQTRGLVNNFFGGEYHSAFKGRGMTFSEVREYQPGDDIRLIDWNVTARSGNPFIKVFEEERELTVILIVDMSASGVFGSELDFKKASPDYWLLVADGDMTFNFPSPNDTGTIQHKLFCKI